jgi:hypothetical protein
MKIAIALCIIVLAAFIAFAVSRWGSSPSPAVQTYSNCVVANPGNLSVCTPPYN